MFGIEKKCVFSGQVGFFVKVFQGRTFEMEA
jgi:hypothetical protein